jgi:hypothetical protein
LRANATTFECARSISSVPIQKQEFRAWLKQFAQWLFSTDHITVRYEISYDGVDIRKLSPGTRGIVLLLLYLALGMPTIVR